MGLNETIKEILQHEAPLGIVTVGRGKAHFVATWNSFVLVVDDKTIAIPAGGMVQTEKNVNGGSDVQLMVASKEVQGLQGMGTGFRLTGKAEFQGEGEIYEAIKSKFPWARAVAVVSVIKTEQLV
jgi:hypothetical protein